MRDNVPVFDFIVKDEMTSGISVDILTFTDIMFYFNKVEHHVPLFTKRKDSNRVIVFLGS